MIPHTSHVPDGGSARRIDPPELPVCPDEALLVLGSLNGQPQDRYLERSRLRPMQIVDESGSNPVPFFDFSWGELGMSSLAWRPDAPLVLYFTTGNDLWKVDLAEANVRRLEVPKLRGVHELTVVGDRLWLANTAFDEVVAFDLAEEHVSSRFGFTEPDSTLDAHTYEGLPETGDDAEVVKKFHCNQVFEGFDGELYALVHHISGRQLVRRVAQKLIKGHGNGGIIALKDGHGMPLKLKGPHSVRKIKSEYWVFDSGRYAVNVYDPGWTPKWTLSTKGWGRGAGFSERLGVFYGGVSEMRQRYSGARKSREHVPNMVLAFSTQSGELLGQMVLSDIEQVNNVYTVSRDVAEALLRLDWQTINGVADHPKGG